MTSTTAKPFHKSKGGKRGVGIARAKGTETCSAASAAEVDVDKPLTDKQKAFVASWAQGNSIGRAALDAGYADDGVGYRLVRQPNILALKAEYAAKYEQAGEMDRRQVMEGFKEAIDMARMKSEPGDMIAGWREIGRMCGYYAPVETKLKIDVSGNVTMTRLTQMTDAELLELIEKGKDASSPPLLESIQSDEDPDA